MFARRVRVFECLEAKTLLNGDPLVDLPPTPLVDLCDGDFVCSGEQWPGRSDGQGKGATDDSATSPNDFARLLQEYFAQSRDEEHCGDGNSGDQQSSSDADKDETSDLTTNVYPVSDLQITLPGAEPETERTDSNPKSGDVMIPGFGLEEESSDSPVKVYPVADLQLPQSIAASNGEIAHLLDQLRQLQDLQVTIEARFITISDEFFERIGVDFDIDIQDNSDQMPDHNSESSDDADDSSDYFDPYAEDDNGGNAWSLQDVRQWHKNNRFVPTLNVPTIVFNAVSVPDGGTILLGGVKPRNPQPDTNQLPLPQLPYINRLFRSHASPDAESIMILVAPKIIIQDEAE